MSLASLALMSAGMAMVFLAKAVPREVVNRAWQAERPRVRTKAIGRTLASLMGHLLLEYRQAPATSGVPGAPIP
jgi:hypothetical protein